MKLLKALGLMDKSPRDILERQMRMAGLRLVEADNAYIHFSHEAAKAREMIAHCENQLRGWDKGADS